jgi:hypothetical protein
MWMVMSIIEASVMVMVCGRKNREIMAEEYSVDLARNFSYMWGYDNIG